MKRKSQTWVRISIRQTWFLAHLGGGNVGVEDIILGFQAGVLCLINWIIYINEIGECAYTLRTFWENKYINHLYKENPRMCV